MNVYATEGEWITCEKGDKIVQLAETVFFGDSLNFAEQLHNWQVVPPALGEPLTKVTCPCGARFVSGTKPGVFHFKDGWRDSRRRSSAAL